MHLISLHRNTRTFLPSNAPEASAEGSRCGLGRGVCARAPFAGVRVARPPKSSGNPKDSGQSWCRTKALQPLLETWRLRDTPSFALQRANPSSHRMPEAGAAFARGHRQYLPADPASVLTSGVPGRTQHSGCLTSSACTVARIARQTSQCIQIFRKPVPDMGRTGKQEY